MTTNSVRSGSFLRRVLPAVSTITAAGAVILLVAKPAEGTSPNGVSELKALHEIEGLEYCYAAGTDALGRGDFEEGKQIYAKCFTPNAPVIITAADAGPNDPPAVSMPSAQAWADFLEVYFPASGFIRTQHLISNVRVDIHPNGNKATITSYLQATHVYDPMSSIQVAHGTYNSEAVKTPYGWKLSKRTFTTMTYLRLDSPEAP